MINKIRLAQHVNRGRLSKVAPVRWLLFLAVLAAGPSLALSNDQVDSANLFARTIVQLKQMPQENSAIFANIALSHLATAYYDEIDVVYSRDANRKQTRWARSVTDYVHGIVLLNDSIVKGAQPAVRLYPHSEAVVQVDNRLITLAHPRVDQQSAFEQGVLVEYCALVDCVPLAESPTQLASAGDFAHAGSDVREMDWQFSSAGTTCSHGQLTIQFNSSDNLKRLREECSELFNELESLISALHWQRQHGVLIDWNFLTVNAMSGRDESSVLLNAFGDTTVVALPRLVKAQTLLSDLTPWLQARLDGVNVIYEIRSQQYNW
ncbi:hypothetical protein [Halioxenophilus aromaticivorans]|uniref:Uncharacterized protein n=1 Tax=Halioxenophilus aromaticivorans TaxID=1306992 RepID=A0AAV3U577_9ALTE